MPKHSPKKTTIRVCNNCSCAEKGSGRIMKKIEKTVGLAAGTENKQHDLDYSACVGCCEFGPNLLVNGNVVLGVDKDSVMEEINKSAEMETLTPEEKRANLDKVLNEDILNAL